MAYLYSLDLVSTTKLNFSFRHICPNTPKIYQHVMLSLDLFHDLRHKDFIDETTFYQMYIVKLLFAIDMGQKCK